MIHLLNAFGTFVFVGGLYPVGYAIVRVVDAVETRLFGIWNPLEEAEFDKDEIA